MIRILLPLALISLSFFIVCESTLSAEEEKPKVNKTESGLEYIIIEEGTGPKPETGQKVNILQKVIEERLNEIKKAWKKTFRKLT